MGEFGFYVSDNIPDYEVGREVGFIFDNMAWKCKILRIETEVPGFLHVFIDLPDKTITDLKTFLPINGPLTPRPLPKPPIAQYVAEGNLQICGNEDYYYDIEEKDTDYPLWHIFEQIGTRKRVRVTVEVLE